jgi:hypothetical protein
VTKRAEMEEKGEMSVEDDVKKLMQVDREPSVGESSACMEMKIESD